MKKITVLIILLFMSNIINSEAKIVDIANKYDLEAELNRNQVTVVVFSACWSGPSRMQRSVIDLVDKHFSGIYRICFAMCEDGFNDDIFVDYGITNVPTMVFYKNGEKYDKRVGLTAYFTLVDIIARGLLSK